jgi:hypothetical protein
MNRGISVLVKSTVAPSKVTTMHEIFPLNILMTMGSLGPFYTNEQILFLLCVKINEGIKILD